MAIDAAAAVMGTDAPLARLEIDLSAITANWRALAERHGSGPVAGVVKADGYGLGAQRVAPALHAAGCRHFFTAHLAEAIAIRPSLMQPGLPGAMLAVLNGMPAGSEAAFLAHGILPVLGTPGEIVRWSALARRIGRRLPALLHIDTGMNRLGLDAGEVAALAANPSPLDGIDLRFVMTHLAASEVPQDNMNAAQQARFTAACAALPSAPRSFANSSGMFLGPGFASDLARPGAALYGINPTPGHPNPMRPVVRLGARVLAVRNVPAGHGVGYNATWVATRASRIATVGVGYADGWLRSHSGRGFAFFDGAMLPLVGRVSMDLTTFDATDSERLQEGDWLELIGPGRPVDDVAEAAGTNGYEVLTSLGRRYQRVYAA
jgi:alanine racemase